LALKEHFPEDGHKQRLKHVAGYTVYNTKNLHICICAGNESSAHGHESFKTAVALDESNSVANSNLCYAL